MTEAIRQQECLNTLKTFNNTIVTIRLYPAHAPQIANAVERGYKTVKQYLRQYGDFVIGLRDNDPELCGEVMDPQVVQSISNLIVFRHLNLLESDRLALTPGLDRTGFKKILQIFTAKVDQIKEEGGGKAYISRMGLEKYFPAAEMDSLIQAGEDVGAMEEPEEKLTVRREYADLLLGRYTPTAVAGELRSLLETPEAGAQVVAATMLGVLEGMVQKKFFVTSAALEQVMHSCAALVDEQPFSRLVPELSRLLLQRTEGRSAALLMSQNFQGDAGKALSSQLLQAIPLDLFEKVIADLRQVAAQLRIVQSQDSRQLQFVTGAIERLLASARGKQFLGQEKARSIMEAGEKARKAKRVESGIKSLLKGSESVLGNDEINAHLPFVLQKMEREGMEREVRAILAKIADYYLKGDDERREKVIRTLAQIGENLAATGSAGLLLEIHEPLMHWLKYSENGDFTYEKVCQTLHWLMGRAWQDNQHKVGDGILSVMYQIRSGNIKRPVPVRAIVGRAQDKGVDRELMKNLLARCLDDPTNEVVSRRLILQGPVVTRFLVDSLIRVEDGGGRLKILDLLTYGEQFLPAILVEKLATPMPWYGKRNLLKLLGDTGSEEHLEVVYPFLQHEDLRVQREAFSCLYRISGKKRRQVLLRILDQCGETLKLQVIRALMPMGDGDVAEALRLVLDEHRFYSDENRDTLLSAACMALARCPYRHAEKILEGFMEQRNERTARKIGAKVWQAAENGLNQIYEIQQDEKQLKLKAGQLRKSLLTRGGMVPGVDGGERSITGLSEEKVIRQLLDKGEREQAKVHVMELIAKVARLRRFTQAEQLRDWLMEIDALALGDIIRAAEIIEGEKRSAIDQDHLAVWGNLLDIFSTDEFSAFYHALQHRQYRDDDLIMKKGVIQDTLLFINGGRVKLFYRDRDKELLAGIVESGRILGTESFFSPSVWTISAAALGPVDASLLTFDKLKELQELQPGIEGKLRTFCKRYDNVEEIFAKRENDRRRYQRHQTPSYVVAVSIVGDRDADLISARGELVDISQGGGSFTMRIARQENARLLLGRGVRLTLPEEETNGRSMVFAGMVVAVKPYLGVEYEYAVHVEFDSIISQEEMEQLMALL